jgi:serine/threonine-protein kinase HipA
VHVALGQWRNVALSADVGMKRVELEDFAPAFEHTQSDLVKRLLA